MRLDELFSTGTTDWKSIIYISKIEFKAKKVYVYIHHKSICVVIYTSVIRIRWVIFDWSYRYIKTSRSAFKETVYLHHHRTIYMCIHMDTCGRTWKELEGDEERDPMHERVLVVGKKLIFFFEQLSSFGDVTSTLRAIEIMSVLLTYLFHGLLGRSTFPALFMIFLRSINVCFSQIPPKYSRKN